MSEAATGDEEMSSGRLGPEQIADVLSETESDDMDNNCGMGWQANPERREKNDVPELLATRTQLSAELLELQELRDAEQEGSCPPQGVQSTPAFRGARETAKAHKAAIDMDKPAVRLAAEQAASCADAERQREQQRQEHSAAEVEPEVLADEGSSKLGDGIPGLEPFGHITMSTAMPRASHSTTLSLDVGNSTTPPDDGEPSTEPSSAIGTAKTTHGIEQKWTAAKDRKAHSGGLAEWHVKMNQADQRRDAHLKQRGRACRIRPSPAAAAARACRAQPAQPSERRPQSAPVPRHGSGRPTSANRRANTSPPRPSAWAIAPPRAVTRRSKERSTKEEEQATEQEERRQHMAAQIAPAVARKAALVAAKARRATLMLGSPSRYHPPRQAPPTLAAWSQQPVFFRGTTVRSSQSAYQA